MAAKLIECIGGDYSGKGGIRFGALWTGPKARKFKGISFSQPKKNYSPSEVIKLEEMGQEQAKSFIGASAAPGADIPFFYGIGFVVDALAGGKKHKTIVAVEFADGKKAAFSIDPNNEPYVCLKLYAIENGLIKHGF